MRTSRLFASLLFAPAIAGAQGGRLLDQGSFTITVNGRTAGRESFRVTATDRGDQTFYLVTGEVTSGDRTIVPTLHTDGTGAAVQYNVVVRSGKGEQKWDGSIIRGRLTAGITTPTGNSAREFIVPSGAVIVDDDVLAHHWVLGLRVRAGRVPALIPRRNNAQVMMTVASVGEERLRIGTDELVATHLRATESGGEVHDIWIDRSGRLLKVAVPSRSLVSVRDDPPA